MHTKIIAMIQTGELRPRTTETLPAARARQDELNARFATAMQSPYVGGEPLDPAQDDIELLRQKARDAQGGRPLWDEPQDTQSSRKSYTTPAARRSVAVAALVKAAAAQVRHSTKRRKKDGEKGDHVTISGKAKTPAELLVQAGKSRRK